MKTLENKQIVITGGSEGIGLAIARAFARKGAALLLIARHLDKLNRAKEELLGFGVRVETVVADLSAADSFAGLTGQILEIFPDIHVLVNNAGAAIFTPFGQVSVQELDYQINLNIKSVFMLTQGLLPSLKQTKGCIINISSFHARRVIPGISAAGYALTKGAINTFTQTLAYELGPYGVRVNAIAPGNVLTDKVKAYMEGIPGQARQKFQETIKTLYPLGRIGSPEDLGGIALYLASEQASWVTGSIISIDGGLTTN